MHVIPSLNAKIWQFINIRAISPWATVLDVTIQLVVLNVTRYSITWKWIYRHYAVLWALWYCSGSTGVLEALLFDPYILLQIHKINSGEHRLTQEDWQAVLWFPGRQEQQTKETEVVLPGRREEIWAATVVSGLWLVLPPTVAHHK